MAKRVASLQRLLTFDSGLKLVTAANGVLGDSLQSFQEINAVLTSAPALPVTFPATGLGNQLAQMARLMSVRGALGMNRQIFFASIGGFDHHENLVASQQGLLTQFDQAVSAFFRTLESFGLTNQVTLFTESEFNRTGNANATLGTDHAWGGHHLIIGGAVRGGGTYGTFPTLLLRGPDDQGSRGTWIPTTSLDQYAATLAGWFGVSDAALNGIFPNLANFPLRRLGFLSTSTSAPSFTEQPLASGTPVRSIHLTELRDAISALRVRQGLSAAAWTDSPLIPGVTMVKRVHLTEMRAALSEVYVSVSRTPPAFTDISGPVFISTGHIQELRSSVLAIW
jgi:hypothetical protein